MEERIVEVENDINLFTDADLAILGAEPEIYKNYAAAIRQEYSVFPDPIYIPGRKKVLLHFLKMERLFKLLISRGYGAVKKKGVEP